MVAERLSFILSLVIWSPSLYRAKYSFLHKGAVDSDSVIQRLFRDSLRRSSARILISGSVLFLHSSNHFSQWGLFKFSLTNPCQVTASLGASAQVFHYNSPSHLFIHCSRSNIHFSTMGACQSTVEYYFGFINLNISHLDVLSFMLGCLFAMGAQALWSCCKKHRQATKSILRSATGQMWGQGQGHQMTGAHYLPYNYPPMPPAYQTAQGPMQPSAPTPAPPAPVSTAVVPYKFTGEMGV